MFRAFYPPLYLNGLSLLCQSPLSPVQTLKSFSSACVTRVVSFPSIFFVFLAATSIFCGFVSSLLRLQRDDGDNRNFKKATL